MISKKGRSNVTYFLRVRVKLDFKAKTFFILYTFIELSNVLYSNYTSFMLPYTRLSYDIHTTFTQDRVTCDDKTSSGNTFFHGSEHCSLCTNSRIVDGVLEVEEMVVMRVVAKTKTKAEQR
jgi:hypothetical protein